MRELPELSENAKRENHKRTQRIQISSAVLRPVRLPKRSRTIRRLVVHPDSLFSILIHVHASGSCRRSQGTAPEQRQSVLAVVLARVPHELFFCCNGIQAPSSTVELLPLPCLAPCPRCSPREFLAAISTSAPSVFSSVAALPPSCYVFLFHFPTGSVRAFSRFSGFSSSCV